MRFPPLAKNEKIGPVVVGIFRLKTTRGKHMLQQMEDVKTKTNDFEAHVSEKPPIETDWSSIFQEGTIGDADDGALAFLPNNFASKGVLVR